jgi:hypothetical protein
MLPWFRLQVPERNLVKGDPTFCFKKVETPEHNGKCAQAQG